MIFNLKKVWSCSAGGTEQSAIMNKLPWNQILTSESIHIKLSQVLSLCYSKNDFLYSESMKLFCRHSSTENYPKSTAMKSNIHNEFISYYPKYIFVLKNILKSKTELSILLQA